MSITPERLREMRTLLDAAPVRYSGTAADACDAAANEIERLRKEVEQMRGIARSLVFDAAEGHRLGLY